MFKRSILFFMFIMVFNTNVFASILCACSFAITNANNHIVKKTKDFLHAVDNNIEDLKKQLDDNYKEFKNRSDVVNSKYLDKLKTLLKKLDINSVSNDNNESIEEYIIKVKLSPTTGEVRRLSEFLYEYKKLEKTVLYSKDKKDSQ